MDNQQSIFIISSSENNYIRDQIVTELVNKGINIKSSNDYFTLDRYINAPFEILKQSSIIIALIDPNAPRIYLELGYAIALDKEIIIVTPIDVVIPSSLFSYINIKLDYNIEKTAYEIIHYIKKLDENSFEKETAYNFEKLNPYEFEKLIFDAFYKTGYQPIENTSIRDAGFDFILNNYKNYKKTIVNVKKYKRGNNVSINQVKDMLYTISDVKADCGIIISASDFTNAAKEICERSAVPIELWTEKEIKIYLPFLSE